MMPQQILVTAQFQGSVPCFDDRELQCENRNALQVRCAAAVISIDDAMDTYGFSRHFAELLASLSQDEIDRLSHVGFSLLELNNERFSELMASVSNPKSNDFLRVRNTTQEQKEQIISENRSALVRRWHLIQLAKIEAMRRLGLTGQAADLLHQATYDNLEKISNFAISLFKLTENTSIVNLAKVTQSSNDLAILTVLRD